MTPNEKSEQLVTKYLLATPIGFHIEDAKKCALIAVDELLEECRLERDWYWEQVKKEIEKL
jgi:hypothetical protein